MFGLVACFAAVAAGLAHPTWYWPVVVQSLCFVHFLYATRLAIKTPSQLRFPFVAFVFTGIYILALPDTFGWTPTNMLAGRLRDALHPLPESNGKPVLFQEWMAWFNNVAQLGFALVASVAVYFVTSILTRKSRIANDNAA